MKSEITSPPLLQIKNLSVDFVSEKETTHAVKNVSLEVHQGEIVALAGESGSGKTVTALSILQLLSSPPAQYAGGEILFYNGMAPVNMLRLSSKALQSIRGHHIAMIFQEPMTSLNPVMSCGRQVMEALLVHKKIAVAAAKEQTIEWLNKVQLPQPEVLFHRYPHQLSGGQKQRVMIAMAMICSPSLLICDEPTTALDVTVQKAILSLIKELQQQQHMGVVFITHDLGVVAQIADRAAIMYRGNIIEENSVQEIFKHPQQPYTKALLACRPALHQKGERLPIINDFLAVRKEDKIISAVTTQSTKLNETEIAKPVLATIKNLSVYFPARRNMFGKTVHVFKAVDDISFDIYKGETLGVVGESGCGKTTLGRALMRLINPASGKIIINDKDITTLNAQQLKQFRQNVQLVFQDPYSSLNPRLTIGTALEEPLLIFDKVSNKQERRKKVKELLDKVNLPTQYIHRYPHQFSGGQRQRIVIARALALNPTLLVCDESVSALDVSIQAQVLNLLNDLKRDLNLTMLFISHDLSVVRYMSDRILVMNRGAIVECGDAATIYQHPQSEYTKKLLAAVPSNL